MVRTFVTTHITTVALGWVFLVAMAVWLCGVVITPLLDGIGQTHRDRLWRTGCQLHPIIPCLDAGWYVTTTWALPPTPAGDALVSATSILTAVWLIVWLLFRNLDDDLWRGW